MRYPGENIVQSLKQWLRPFTPYILLVGSLALSLTVAFTTVEMDLRPSEYTSNLWILAIILLYLSSLIIPLIAVAISVYLAWQHLSRSNGLSVILTAYLTIIISFAGYYYSVTYIEDYNDCVNRYHHFKAEFEKGQFDNRHPILEPPNSVRAFHGMQYRFWQLGEYNETVADEINDIRDIINQQFEDVIHPIEWSLGYKIPIFSDCLHFSVISMTLFGYGTVTPSDWKVKLANSLEVLTGTLLLVVLLGLLMAKREN